MMEIQAADGAVSVWVRQERPPEGAALERLIRRELARRGLAPWGQIQAEYFAAGEDTLIIARPVRGRRPAFYFARLEELLAGALACADGPSALYTCADGYLLAADVSAAGPALYEFGQAGAVRADWERHAAEQGRCLIARDAIAVLRRYFGGQM